MERFRQLIASVKRRFPKDNFFDEFDLRIEGSVQAREMFGSYDRAFSKMPEELWIDFLGKVVGYFRDHRNGQLKQGFFTRLNEAFAYEYLNMQGFEQIRFIPEGGGRSPDLSYLEHGELKRCEVKAICVSQDELDRVALGDCYDSSVYTNLSNGFLAKFLSTISVAGGQIDASGTGGLIFIVLFFDDYTLQYYDNYERQITQLIDQCADKRIYVKVGLLGERSICSSGLPSS
ncbi:hypothetical protein [Pseudomonas putida]|uniref:hypothetical protein n=1 Tax=Pseudomonas putida TaxID=303 RepID=UPI003905E184